MSTSKVIANMSKDTKVDTSVLSELQRERSECLEPLVLHKEKISAALGNVKADQEIRNGLDCEVLQIRNMLQKYFRWYTAHEPNYLYTLVLFHSSILSIEEPVLEFKARLTSAGNRLDEYVNQLEQHIDDLDTVLIAFKNATSVEDIINIQIPSFEGVDEFKESEISDLGTEWNNVQLIQWFSSLLDKLKVLFDS